MGVMDECKPLNGLILCNPRSLIYFPYHILKLKLCFDIGVYSTLDHLFSCSLVRGVRFSSELG